MITLELDKEGQGPVEDSAVSERSALENPDLIAGQITAVAGLESHSVRAESPVGPVLRRAASTDAKTDLIAVAENCSPSGSGKNSAEALFKSLPFSPGLRYPQTDARIRPARPD